MFLTDPDTPEAAAFLTKQREADGFVMNLERAWAWRPDVAEAFVALRKRLTEESSLDPREIALLVCSTARVLGDSYCSLAWGRKFADMGGSALAAEVLRGGGGGALTERERALQGWAQQVVQNPNGATPRQIDALRTAGLSDREIFEATAFIALRLAFSTVNDALGAQPDPELVAAAPPEVRAAVTYGRAPST